MKSKIFFFLVLILSVSYCSKSDVSPSSSYDSTDDEVVIVVSMSPEARDYLNELIFVMKDNSINRQMIDWVNFKNEVFEQANQAQTIQETYPGILKAIELLGDNHSFYRTSTGGYLNPNNVSCNGTGFLAPNLPSNIGYVKVNNYSGSSITQQGIDFAQDIQNQIITYDHSEVIGWIVDLRGNVGGNMWPMLTGIGPVLGDGIAGYFSYPDESFISWSYVDGVSRIEDNIIMQLNNPYTLINPNPKVAVLLDNGVASSGEAIAVSFLSRDNTLTFGSNTCGLSTSNEQFTMSDSAVLILTTAYMADRNQNIYGSEIEPEQLSSTVNIIEEAVNWIEN